MAGGRLPPTIASHIRALASSLVVLACLVTTPVIANRDPPRDGYVADQSALVPDWPPWYDSGFWTVRISDVPGGVMNYVSATCPTSEVWLAWGETPDFSPSSSSARTGVHMARGRHER